MWDVKIIMFFVYSRILVKAKKKLREKNLNEEIVLNMKNTGLKKDK